MTHLAFSPDGKTLATGSKDTRVLLWDLTSNPPELRAEFRDHQGGVSALTYSPDGKILATAGSQAAPVLWNVATRQRIAALPKPQNVTALAFSPDGSTLATGGLDVIPSLWDTATGTLQEDLPKQYYATSALAFSPDRQTLAVAYGHTVLLWALRSHQRRGLLEHAVKDGVDRLAFAPNGKLLATGTLKGEVSLWDVTSGQPAGPSPVAGNGVPVSCLAFSPDGRTLAIGRMETTLLWKLERGQNPRPLAYHTGRVTALDFSRDGRWLATASRDGRVALWNAETGEPVRSWSAGASALNTLAFASQGATLATGNDGGSIQFWNAATPEETARLSGQSNRIKFSDSGRPVMVRSIDGRWLAAGSDDGSVRVWDLHLGQLKLALEAHARTTTAVALSPRGNLLASGSQDGTLRLWNVERRQPLNLPVPAGRAVAGLAFSADARVLAVGRSGGGVEFWDTVTRSHRADLPEQASTVSLLAFSPDGRTLAMSANDGETRLWDAASRRPKAGPQFPPGPVLSLAFSADGRRLATGHSTAAYVWDLEKADLVTSLKPLEGGVFELGFSSDGRQLFTRCGPSDGRLQRWDATTGRMIPNSSPEAHPLPAEWVQSVLASGSALTLHDPRDGRERVTFLAIGARDWLAATPEGYFDCSTNATRLARWDVNGVLYPVENYLDRFRRPDLVRKALRGERPASDDAIERDVPPSAAFLEPRGGATVRGNALPVVRVEASDDEKISRVELFINDRPVPPVGPGSGLSARPIRTGAKAFEFERGIALGGAETRDPNHRFSEVFEFHSVPLPRGAPQIRLKAIAIDGRGRKSDPAEITLQRPGARPTPGRLYALCVGVSRYRNADGKTFRNLRFPASDARAVADRLGKEKLPLYEKPIVHLLSDEQATARRVKEELHLLQANVRPGQIDTVILYLSGHGISQGGSYFFATYDTDLRDLASTSLSAADLREALGSKLQAKAVFLFVDTCHAGALAGDRAGRNDDLQPGRNDDLPLGMQGMVLSLVSSDAQGSAFESPAWGHGAFTLALLHALNRRDKQSAPGGVIHFSTLIDLVSEEISRLMVRAGLDEHAQDPGVLFALRQLRVPVAQIPP